MKTLIVVTYPNMDDSVVNKRWLKELKKKRKNMSYMNYTKSILRIDVLAEQELIEKFDKIVLKFPFYWFNCPPLLKK